MIDKLNNEFHARFYKPNDPYYYEVDNLPLIDLLVHSETLRAKVNEIITNTYTRDVIDTKLENIYTYDLKNIDGDVNTVINDGDILVWDAAALLFKTAATTHFTYGLDDVRDEPAGHMDRSNNDVLMFDTNTGPGWGQYVPKQMNFHDLGDSPASPPYNTNSVQALATEIGTGDQQWIPSIKMNVGMTLYATDVQTFYNPLATGFVTMFSTSSIIEDYFGVGNNLPAYWDIDAISMDFHIATDSGNAEVNFHAGPQQNPTSSNCPKVAWAYGGDGAGRDAAQVNTAAIKVYSWSRTANWASIGLYMSWSNATDYYFRLRVNAIHLKSAEKHDLFFNG